MKCKAQGELKKSAFYRHAWMKLLLSGNTATVADIRCQSLVLYATAVPVC